jgi:hypothetical protein
MKIRMEPELEELAGDLNPSQRRGMAAKLERWAHELRVTAFALERQAAPRPRRVLPRLSRARQTWN